MKKGFLAAVLIALSAWAHSAMASAPDCGNRFGMLFEFLYCETQDDTVHCSCDRHFVNPDNLVYLSEREGVGNYLANWSTHQPDLILDLNNPDCEHIYRNLTGLRFYNVSPDPEYFHRSSDGRNFWWEGGLLVHEFESNRLRERLACKARQYEPPEAR